jgi:hypothetical protein
MLQHELDIYFFSCFYLFGKCFQYGMHTHASFMLEIYHL